jgi:hypothetical protein
MNFTAPPEYTRPKFLEWADAHIPYDSEDRTWLGKRNAAYTSWNEAWKQSTAEQTALIESLQNRWAARPLSAGDTTALEERCARLEAALEQAAEDLQLVGDDYPDSSCHKWCSESAAKARSALTARGGQS